MEPRKGVQDTSKLLIHESPLQVLPSLAVAVGLSEAMFLQQLHYMSQNPNLGIDTEAGRYVFNTLRDWEEIFPFWSGRTIERIIARLVEQQLITVKFLGERWDRTRYYRIDYEKLDRVKLTKLDHDNLTELDADNLSGSSLQRSSKNTSKNHIAAEKRAAKSPENGSKKPRAVSKDQILKDAVAQHIQQIDPKLGGRVTGEVAQSIAAVWRADLGIEQLSAEQYATIASTIPRFVALYQSSGGGDLHWLSVPKSANHWYATLYKFIKRELEKPQHEQQPADELGTADPDCAECHGRGIVMRTVENYGVQGATPIMREYREEDEKLPNVKVLRSVICKCRSKETSRAAPES